MEDKFTNANIEAVQTGCDYKKGLLPSCAPLAVSYVPEQQKNPPKYSSEDALTRGTLFPGLDLPFMNIPNMNNPYAGTPLGEVMAIEFVITELILYLDTHKDDMEAFHMLKTVMALQKEANERYTKLYGPITPRDMADSDKYTWLNNPWPWEYAERGAKK